MSGQEALGLCCIFAPVAALVTLMVRYGSLSATMGSAPTDPWGRFLNVVSSLGLILIPVGILLVTHGSLKRTRFR